MKQEVSFGLMDLIRAVEEAAEVTAQSDLDNAIKDDFREWWNRQKRTTIRALEGELARADGATLLWHGLGIYVLNPERVAGKTVLKSELPKHIVQLQNQLNTFEGNINGHSYSPSTPWRVLTEQITEMWKTRREVRELRILLEQTLGSNRTSLESHEALSKFKDELSDEVETRLDDLLGRLERLDYVVRNVCSLLPTAYRTNQDILWETIGRWLRGRENSNQDKPWVPRGLEAHRTLTWISNLRTKLKDRRSKLEESVDEITYCLRWQKLEKAKPADTASSTSEQPGEESKQWAQKWIANSWRKANGRPLGVESLLEYAKQKLGDLREKAEPSNYKYEEYNNKEEEWTPKNPVEGTYRVLTEQIRKQLSWQQESNLDEYLNDRISIIKELREKLLGYLGGRLPGGSSESPPYHPWNNVCETVTSYLRKGEFEKVHGKCGESIEEITSKINSLQAVIDSHQGDRKKAGMIYMLLEQAAFYQAQLEQELTYVNDLDARIDPLKERFTRCWENFSSQLSQRTYPEQGWFSRLRRAIGLWDRQEDLKDVVSDSFKEAQDVCPKHPEVLGWQEKLHESGGPDTKTWQNKHLKGLPCPCEEKLG